MVASKRKVLFTPWENLRKGLILCMNKKAGRIYAFR